MKKASYPEPETALDRLVWHLDVGCRGSGGRREFGGNEKAFFVALLCADPYLGK
jgi:hypothetical protein